MILWIMVKVVGVQPKLATCKVVITHDDLTDTFEDMAGVKVTTARGGAAPEADDQAITIKARTNCRLSLRESASSLPRSRGRASALGGTGSAGGLV